MDLVQRKLVKNEWEGIEIPLSKEEIDILKLLIKGYSDVNLKNNKSLSILSYLKIENTPEMHAHLYELYFKEKINQQCKKFKLTFSPKTKTSKKIKKADKIRIESSNKKIKDNSENIFEFVIIKTCVSIFKNYYDNKDRWMYYLYALNKLNSYSIYNLNTYLKEFVTFTLKKFNPEMDIGVLILNGKKFIEQNSYILKYEDQTLYNHQKEIFSIVKQNKSPKLILYTAPTGTGKTITPIGLSEGHRILFVCAARHVGLALAKASVSIQKKVAFAFGCKDAGDIRLHYYSVTECVRDRRTGGIRKVDNSQGEAVEIMISDIQSFQSAMLYMLAFNKPEDIILYWDEPTITMDYESSDYHSIIHENWKINTIPNIVLSTATLPTKEELSEVFVDFNCKFEDAQVFDIRSHDTKKSISLINKNGFIEVPHLCISDYEQLQECVRNIENNKTLLRYLDVGEVCDFIIYLQKENIIPNSLKIENNYFEKIEDVTLTTIKLYYIKLLKGLNKIYWSIIYDAFQLKKRKAPPVSNILVTTKDAHSLTDGPTLFLTANVEKIAQFCMKTANIPEDQATILLSAIDHNQRISELIYQKEKDYEDGTKKDEGKDRKLAEGRVDANMKTIMKEIEALRSKIIEVKLNDLFIPNRKEHMEKWSPQNREKLGKSFTCNIEEKYVEKIMELPNVDNIWKMLLLMGIGVFANHVNANYVEIMKMLADEKKLFMIVATTDYIYGTNYQFCHEYISKDLADISQEKCLQALGRVGRRNIQQDYTIRFRDDSIIKKILLPEENKPEVKNMCKLFNSD